MDPIFNSVLDLPGKMVRPLMVDLCLELKFDLWTDYTRWLPPEDRLDFWYDQDTLEQNQVEVSVGLTSYPEYKHVFRQFETFNLVLPFEDIGPNPINLRIGIQGLTNLPVRDDTGIFTCGMIEIVSARLQDVEVGMLLPNTMYGEDGLVILPIPRPIYPWMLENLYTMYPNQLP